MKRFKLIPVLLLLVVCSQAFATVRTLQVTLGSGATQITVGNITCKWVVFQNNASHSMRIGDSNVTSSRGLLLTASGSFFAPPAAPQGFTTNLNGWYVIGTSSDVIDIIYDDGQ